MLTVLPQAVSAPVGPCVQRLVRPDPTINSEQSLFFHKHGVAGFDTAADEFYISKDARLHFDSYFNAFPAHLFDLEGQRVSLTIRGRGKIIAEVMLARHERSWDRLVHKSVDLNSGMVEIQLPDLPLDGVVYLSVIALTDAAISCADYRISGMAQRIVNLSAVITTYKRDAAVQSTAARLQTYFAENSDLKDRFSLLVVDNGGETNSIPFEKGEVVKSPNLGGAGGFTRGLKIAVERGWATHVLFMDDDANFFPESIRRTIALLSFTKTENLAVSGAMITEALKWRMWENSATFNQKCTPIDLGCDLREAHEVIKISHAQPRHAANKYGGWWYFCFPIKAVEVWPFPFFVRGDDSYFSLANNFEIVTMLGVVAHQEDFFSKQSPLTVYLDFRYHLVHHLTFKDIKLSPESLVKMASRYFNRFNNSYHYDSAAAINLAISDVLAGQRFWNDHIDMSARRNVLRELSTQEQVKSDLTVDVADVARHSPKRNKGWIASWIRRFSFNGHLLPRIFFYKKGISFPLHVRAVEHDTFLRHYSVTVDMPSSAGYICRINRKRYFQNLKEFRQLCRKLKSQHSLLVNEYGAASLNLTSKQAWDERFEEHTENRKTAVEDSRSAYQRAQ